MKKANGLIYKNRGINKEYRDDIINDVNGKAEIDGEMPVGILQKTNINHFTEFSWGKRRHIVVCIQRFCLQFKMDLYHKWRQKKRSAKNVR